MNKEITPMNTSTRIAGGSTMKQNTGGKSMKTGKAALITLIAMGTAFGLQTAQASVVWTGLGVGDGWDTAGNWDTGVPTDGDEVTIGNGFTVNAPNTVNLATFDLNLQGTLNYGAGANFANGGTITVSGNGQLIGVPDAFIAPNAGTTTFSLEGDSAQISNFAQMGSFDSDTTVNWNLTPGTAGINSIAMNGAVWQGILLKGTDNLSVDLTGYNIANGDSLTLFEYSVYDAGELFESVVINGQSIGSNLGAGTTTPFTAGPWSGDLVIAGTSASLTNLDYVVPEPSTLALLGTGLALLVAARRRLS